MRKERFAPKEVEADFSLPEDVSIVIYRSKQERYIKVTHGLSPVTTGGETLLEETSTST